MSRSSDSAVGEPGREQRRTSFGSVAGTYAAVRPQWPAATVAWLTGSGPEGSGPEDAGPEDAGPEDAGPEDAGPALDVLDLGAGTGKLTAALLAAGHRVVAVDSSPQMLEQLAASAPGAQVRAGSAEQIPMDDACVDVVTVAQAWHWFDPERAAAECLRVLRRGGLLAIAWHARDERVDWIRELSALTGRPHHPAAQDLGAAEVGPTAETGVGPEAGLEQLRLGRGFGPVEYREFAYRQQLTADQLVDLASTWSYVAVSARRAAILDAVHELALSVADADGRIVVPHRTWCYRTRGR